MDTASNRCHRQKLRSNPAFNGKTQRPVIMAPTYDTFTTDPHGLVHGVSFNDEVAITDLNKTAISRIEVTYDTYLRSLTVGISTVFVRKLLIRS